MCHDRPLILYRRLLGYLAGSSRRVTLILLVLLIYTAAMLLLPWLVKSGFRDAVLHQAWGQVYGVLGLIFATLIAIVLARFVAEHQTEVASLEMLRRVRSDVAGKLLRLPAASYVRGRSGDPVSLAFNDVNALRAFLESAVFAVGSDLLRLVGAVGMLFLLSWRLALIAGVGGTVAGAIVAMTSPLARRRFHSVQEALADMTSLLTEQARALPTIQALGTAESERRRFAACARRHFREAVLGHRVHSLMQAALSLLGSALAVVCLAMGVLAAAGEVDFRDTAERAVGFSLYAAVAIGPINRVGRTNHNVQQALAAARHLFRFLDAPEESSDGRRTLAVRPQGLVRFNQVSFAYRPHEPVLSGFDLTVQPGETIAIVGRSGAGKSTVTQLLLRFYDPDHGSVLLDGHDLRELRRADLRRHIGWVGQDPVILSGTVADNIRYGCRDASRGAVALAAEMACATDFIRELPLGYDTRVGERGLDLSGGQRARLALARVILRCPAVVVLDEVTAALDTQTEGRLWANLEPWLAERTTVIIAHRLLTVLSRPRIIVLEGGRSVADGPADALRQSPEFNELFRRQMHLGPMVAA
jgi:ATP-binding cassette, subfamily B, bacterial MsbA